MSHEPPDPFQDARTSLIDDFSHGLDRALAELALTRAALANAEGQRDVLAQEVITLRLTCMPTHGLIQLAQRVATASEPRLLKYATAARGLLATMKVDETLAALSAPSTAAATLREFGLRVARFARTTKSTDANEMTSAEVVDAVMRGDDR